MKWTALAAAALLSLATPAVATMPAGVSVGDKAPDFSGKEYINTGSTSLKQLQGQVIVYEIFRTW
ncbi:MAG: hypothetical protein ACYTDX_09750 [Planctomycetota bacterium]|jgi:hypothetical protein